MNHILEYQESPTRQKKRKAILENSMKYFTKIGLYTPTMQDIASYNNVSLRTLYYYYSSKELLASDIQIVALNQLATLLDSYDYNYSICALDNLSAILFYYFDCLTQNPIMVNYITAFDYFYTVRYPISEYIQALDEINTSTILTKVLEQSDIDHSIDFHGNQKDLFLTTIFQSLFAYSQKMIYRKYIMSTEKREVQGDIHLFIELLVQTAQKR